MDEDILSYIQRMELLAIFSGYPLVYSIIQFISHRRSEKTNRLTAKLPELLPLSYAFLGTLYFALFLKEIFIDQLISFSPIFFLKIWGALAFLFWFPRLRRTALYSLLHSLVFFLLIVKDLFTEMGSASGRDMIANDMRIYTLSLLANIIVLGIIVLIYIIRNKTLHTNRNQV
jgi:hypothetical protein